ncbi:MAG: ABC transporter ATP-binding protein [bacterium]
MSDAPEQRTDWGMIRRLGPYLSPHRRWITVVAICTPLGVAADLVPPILLKHGIDQNIAHGDFGGLTATAALFFGVVLVGFTLQSMGLYALQLIGLRALASLRRGVFSSVLGQGARFFDKRTTGSLMTRTTTDVEAIYESLTFGAVGLITDALVILGTLCIMLWLDWRMTLVAFSIAPIIIGVVNVVRKRLRALFSEIRAILSKLNGFFAEQINGMTVLQLYGGEARAREEFRGQAHHYMVRYKAANWWDAGLYAVMDGMSALSVGLILFFATSRFGVDKALTLGLLVAFIDYVNKVFVPIREFSGRIATIQRAIAALEKVLALAEIDERVAPGHVPLPRPAGAVEFEGVRFAYGPDKPAVLQDVSFQVKPGEVVALVGATGSGKTTIGRLLQRRYDGYEGSIRLDGVELRDIRVQDVCGAITVVHQDAHLFEATIAENITLWNPAIDEATMTTAAERARAAQFIATLPDGYGHAITERGGNISAGQRQLLTIARAMACHSPVVILDEATASVDSLTEAHR